MVKIEKFLGCCDLERSVSLLACNQIILNGFAVSAIVNTLEKRDEGYFRHSDPDHYDIFLKVAALVIVIKIIAAIFLILGVKTRTSCLIMPELVLSIAYAFFQSLILIFNPTPTAIFNLGEFNSQRMIYNFIALIIIIYWFLCVKNVYGNIKNENIVCTNVESGPVAVTSQTYMRPVETNQPLISIQAQSSAPTDNSSMPYNTEQPSYGFNTNLPYLTQNNNFQQPRSEDLPPSYDQAITHSPSNKFSSSS